MAFLGSLFPQPVGYIFENAVVARDPGGIIRRGYNDHRLWATTDHNATVVHSWDTASMHGIARSGRASVWV